MDTEVAETPVEPWFADGLKFKCTGCGKCCTGSPGYVFLSNADLENLSNHFHLSLDEFTKKYTRYIDGQYALLDRPTSYDCVFLKDRRCLIYPVRPYQCKSFPWWPENLSGEEAWQEVQKRCPGTRG